MTSELLKIAIFGAGRWGTHLIRNFLTHPQAQVMAIADPSADRLAALKQQFSLDASILLTTNWEAAMAHPEITVVAIATPATTHYTLIQAALKQGYHVLAEKPLTLDYQEAIALCQLAEHQQRQLVIDHTYLFHSAVQQGQQVIQQGQLSTPRYGYASRTHLGPVRQDVDALWDLAIHDIAIFNHWLGAYPVEVQAEGTLWLQTGAERSSLFARGLSDLVWLKLVYPNSFEARIHLCWANPDKQRRLCLVGDRGTLIFDELALSPLTLQQGQFEAEAPPYTPTDLQTQPVAIASQEPLRQVCDHFLHCALQNQPSTISSGWVGASLVAVLLALSESLNQGGTVVEIPDLRMPKLL